MRFNIMFVVSMVVLALALYYVTEVDAEALVKTEWRLKDPNLGQFKDTYRRPVLAR